MPKKTKTIPFGTMIEEIAYKQLPAENKGLPKPVKAKPAPAAAPTLHSTDLEGQQAWRSFQAELEKLQIEEFQQKLQLRSKWSGFLMIMVVVMIFFQMALFVSVGLQWLTFGDEWIARLVLPGTFAQILGFVYIIITYLFPTKTDKKEAKPTPG